MLRPLTLLAAAAAMAGTATHALRSDPGALAGTVQPHAVEIVVRQPDAATTARYDGAGFPGAAETATKVIVRRTLHGNDPAAPRLIRRACPKAETPAAEVGAHPVAQALRS